MAGQVDAMGFVIAGGYFTSFMSGNTTRLGVDLAANLRAAGMPLGLIASFVAGVVGGSLIAGCRPRRRKTLLLSIVALLLSIASLTAISGSVVSFLYIAAAAMGVSNNSFSRDGEVTVGVTYMTGALVRFGQAIASRISGAPHPAIRSYGLLWASLALGAVAGGWLFAQFGAKATVIPVVIAMLLAIYASRIERATD